MDQLASIMGGRAAEMLVYNEITTGAANDLNQATTLSRQMVTQYGMSAKLGPRTFGKVNELVFLGRDIAETRDYSESVAEQIDGEVTGLVSEAHQRAADILRQNEEALRRVADNLIRLETIGIEDLEAILEGKELPDPIEAVKEEPAETEAEATPPTSESPAPPPTGRLAEDPGSPA
jgi:cell division protease FtsH